jgi:hypothetical protein
LPDRSDKFSLCNEFIGITQRVFPVEHEPMQTKPVAPIDILQLFADILFQQAGGGQCIELADVV